MKRRRDDEPAAAPKPPCAGRSVFPGDVLVALSFFDDAPDEQSEKEQQQAPVTLGSGVLRDGGNLRATTIGLVRWDGVARRLWVEGAPRRYVPARGDHVIGIVVEKHAEEYRLHVGAAAPASLPVLAFDGATKRNRPHLEVGALVYARITLAHRDMEPEATCAAPPGVGAKDWVTNESVFGELASGHVFDCPITLCRRLAGADDCPVLEAIGDLAPFELAIGANGRVWISSGSAAVIVLAQLAILQSEGVRDEDHAALVEKISTTFDLDTHAAAGGSAAY